MTIVSEELLNSVDQKKLHALRIFLRIYGALSLALFSALLLGFIVQYQPLDEGQPLHWVIWDRVDGHVGPLQVINMIGATEEHQPHLFVPTLQSQHQHADAQHDREQQQRKDAE